MSEKQEIILKFRNTCEDKTCKELHNLEIDIWLGERVKTIYLSHAELTEMLKKLKHPNAGIMSVKKVIYG